MYCPKCREENEDNAKFCKKCGEPLETDAKPVKTSGIPDKNKLLIIGLIAVVAVLAAGVLFAGGMFKSEVPLETKDFEVFTMDVPVGASFEEFTSIPAFGNIGGLVYLKNVGSYSEEVSTFGISKMGASIPSQMKFERDEGDVKIFKDKEDTGLYMAAITIDDFFIDLMGKDPDTMVRMLNSIQITDADAIETENSTPATTSSTQSAPASSTPSSISILGGSFSTGSGDEDKTYAKINVGTSHAGEDVIVQIYYSRDGSNLNNGNMVPATVHSDGYLEITSADAYEYYPDHATINIYDSNSKLLTTKSVSLMPAAGTQTF